MDIKFIRNGSRMKELWHFEDSARMALIEKSLHGRPCMHVWNMRRYAQRKLCYAQRNKAAWSRMSKAYAKSYETLISDWALYKGHYGSNPSPHMSLPNLRRNPRMSLPLFYEILTLENLFWWIKAWKQREEGWQGGTFEARACRSGISASFRTFAR